MSDTFQRRLKAAAGAAWWTVLIWWAVLMVSWLASLAIMHIRPGWVLTMLGDGMTWAELQRMYIWFIGGFKILGMMAALFAAFLSIWHHRLRKLEKQ